MPVTSLDDLHVGGDLVLGEEWWDEKVDVVTDRGGENTGGHKLAGWSPSDAGNWLILTQLDLPQLNTSENLPHSDSSIIATSRKPKSNRVDRNRSNLSNVTDKLVGGEGWERSEILGRGKLWKQRLGVNVELLSPDSGSKIKIQTSLESLVDALVVSWDETEGVVLLGQVVLVAIFWFLLFPFLSFLVCWEVLGRWVVRLVVGWWWEFRCGNVHDVVGSWWWVVGPDVVELLFSALLWLVGYYASFSDGLDNLHHTLSFVFRWNKSALWFWCRAERHNLRL